MAPKMKPAAAAAKKPGSDYQHNKNSHPPMPPKPKNKPLPQLPSPTTPKSTTNWHQRKRR
jgi:hypothetical protein